MGFRPEPTIYNLSFSGTPLDGLHVRASTCTVDEYNRMLKAAVSTESECPICRGKRHIDDPVTSSQVDCPTCDGKGKIVGAITPQVLEDNEFILQLFANHLVSWDLEDLAGQTVPCSREGLGSQERTLVAQLITSWQVAMVTIPNLPRPESSDGSGSAPPSLGLGSASQNLES